MAVQDQTKQISSSLKLVTDICNDCEAEYRILGSVILVAYTGTIFRTIHDIDVLLDATARNCVFEKLEMKGFRITERKSFGFRYFEAKKQDFLTITFLLIGKFYPDYFTWPFSKILELRISNAYIKPTRYHVGRIEFTGIPISSAIAGIRMSFLNPKRAADREALGAAFQESHIKLYDNIAVYACGIKLPYVYDVFSFLYNLYGGLRVKIGRKYEVWE